MARVSFTLRRTDSNPDLGSYLRFDDAVSYESSAPGGSAAASIGPGSRVDYDSALRADGIQIAPEDFEEFFFEANSVCYGEVQLEWALNISEPAETPVVTGVVMVYSDLGEPQTIASGTILVESDSVFNYVHEGLPQGKWAYYSLFVHYQSTGGDNYYEKVASLDVLVPKDYGSTMQLWNRIPEYYRVQDSLIGSEYTGNCLGSSLPADRVVGPLFKYLSIIGFDIDRIRTIVDHLMINRDPAVANTATLDALSQQMAAILRSSDLGGQRLRALMNDIGFFRRTKGTEIGVEYFAKAISNSDIEIDQDNNTIKVFSQRVNYITVPKNGTGIVTHRAAGDVEQEEANALPFSDTTYNAYSGSYTYSGTDFSTTGSGAGDDVNSVIFHIDSVVPVRFGDTVGFSVHSNIGTDALKWVRVVDASENVMGFSDVAKSVNGVRAYEVNIDNQGASSGAASIGVYHDGYIEACVDLSVVPVFRLAYMLAERNHLGEYFDGDTIRGGWLVDSSSVSDYRWAGSANASQSIFAEDYERSKSILDVLLFSALPINEAQYYTITSYNAIPGIT